MKHLVFIPLFFLSINVIPQDSKFLFRKTTSPCSPALTDTIKGKWIYDGYHIDGLTWNNTQREEGLKRVKGIQNVVAASYPSPTGALVSWSTVYAASSFADQVTYVMNQNNMTNEEKVKTNPVARLQYNLILFPYFCHNDHEIWNIYPNISGGTGLTIHANTLPVLNGQVLQEEGMTINGRPIKYKMPVMGTWKGYEMMTPEGGANAHLFNTRCVLISRKGMLPYIPVTRKQYLELAIKYLDKKYDDWIAGSAEIPDKKEREKGINDLKIIKDETLKAYRDELEKTTKQGLSDSAAIVFGGPGELDLTRYPIFFTEAEGGRMLVTENPAYFRTDLPKYVPQLFVLEWSWTKDSWSENFRKSFEENFQVEEFQELIDK